MSSRRSFIAATAGAALLPTFSARAQANTLRWVVPYPAGGFAQLARSAPLPSAEQQLRLINGFYGGGEPRVGQLVKVVD